MSITRVGIEEEKAPTIGSPKGTSRTAVIIMLKTMLKVVINASLEL